MSHEDPKSRLQRWVSEQKSQAAAARLIGCHSSYLTHLLAEGSSRGVGLGVAFAIERATAGWSEGPILARDWVPEDPAPTEPLEATGTDGV